MSKIFYDHLVVFEEVEIALSKQKLSPKEKAENSQIIEEIVHHRIVTRILTHLPKEHHKEFLERFQKAPHDKKTLHFLKEKVSDIEDQITDEVDRLKRELLDDIGG